MVKDIRDVKKLALMNALRATPVVNDKSRGEYTILSATTASKIVCHCYDLIDFWFEYRRPNGTSMEVDESFVKGYIAGMEV